MSNDWHYREADLVTELKRAGVGAGDTLFVHTAIEALGQAQDCDSAETQRLLLRSLQTVVGPQGTILVPTYTFSFCKQEIFDVNRTPTDGGPWSPSADFLEYFRSLPGVIRSRDPIHSIAALGPMADNLVGNVPNTCFGDDSVFDRLLKIGGKICMIGVGLEEATFRHFVEERAGVPFRFKKLFTGYVRENDRVSKAGWIYSVRILADNGFPDGTRLEKLAVETGVCRVVRLGLGEIKVIAAAGYFDLTQQALRRDPWFTAKGPAGDPVEFERRRVNGPRFALTLPQVASESELIEALWSLPRDIISEGYDAALQALTSQLPMTIHEYPTGTECWSWLIPEKWTCHEAYLETIEGKRLLSYAENPLHVVSYSLPFEGEVSREELLKHLHVHPRIAEAVPFIFKYYERDWGLCCSRKLKESLADERYRVVIKTDFSYGTLKIGEVVAPGKSDDCIVLCAHLCHPAMVNDDLSGVIVGLKVMQELLKCRDLRYTYRYLIVPETIGGVAYLSHHEELIPRMKGGLFLEMLGLDNPPALQLSFAGNTELDQCFTLALKKHDYHGWTGPFRTVIGNDERQFNAPGVRVPMLTLARVLPASAPDWPYPEYHSSFDSPALCSVDRLADSRDLVLKMIATLEQNRIPINRYKGEVFCSRYGLHIDWYQDPEGNKAMFDVMDHIDGTRSIAEIAIHLGVSFDAVKRTVDELHTRGLVEYAD
jgi:aminopeptidase-like protein/aminoglycoside N3'-acetyltransferase